MPPDQFLRVRFLGSSQTDRIDHLAHPLLGVNGGQRQMRQAHRDVFCCTVSHGTAEV